MSTAPVLTSRTVGLAENALRAILKRALAGTSLDYPRWVTVNIVATAESPVPSASLVRQVTGGLKLETGEAAALVDELIARGFISRDGDALVTTAHGAAIFQQVSARVRPIAQRIYAGIDVQDLIVAERVLPTITERANAILVS